MNIKVNSNRFILFVGSSICMTIFELLMPEMNGGSQIWYKSIAIYILVLLGIQLVFLKAIMPKHRFLLFLVVILYYLFNFSQVILHAFDFKMDSVVESSSIFRYYSMEVPQATVIAIQAGIGLFIGYMLFYCFKGTNNNFYVENDLTFLTFRSLRTALIIIGGLFDLVSTILYMYLSRIGGYVNTLSISIPYPIRLCSYFLLPGVLLLLAADDLTAKKKKKVLVLYVVYKLACMLSGYRAYSLINIIIAIYFYYRSVYKKKLPFIYIIIGYFGAQIGGGLLVGIRNTRATGIEIGTVISSIFAPSSNIFLNMISEFGITLNVLCVAIAKGSVNDVVGGQLLTSFLSIVPGVSKILTNVDFDGLTMDTALGIRNFGGSYVGDLFFDFGYRFLLISAIVLGVFFAYIYEHYELDILEGRYLKAAIVSPIMVEFIFCTRSSLAKMPRMIVWYLIMLMVVKRIFYNTRKGR